MNGIKAIGSYKELVGKAPDNITRKKWQAQVMKCFEEQSLLKTFKDAKKNIEKMDWEMAENDLDALLKKRQDYEWLGETANSLYQQVIDEQRSITELEIQADRYKKEKNWSDAVEMYSLLMSKVPPYTQKFKEWEKTCDKCRTQKHEQEKILAEHYNRGVEAYNKKDLEEAHGYFEFVVNQKPDYKNHKAKDILDEIQKEKQRYEALFGNVIPAKISLSKDNIVKGKVVENRIAFWQQISWEKIVSLWINPKRNTERLTTILVLILFLVCTIMWTVIQYYNAT